MKRCARPLESIISRPHFNVITAKPLSKLASFVWTLQFYPSTFSDSILHFTGCFKDRGVAQSHTPMHHDALFEGHASQWSARSSGFECDSDEGGDIAHVQQSVNYEQSAEHLNVNDRINDCAGASSTWEVIWREVELPRNTQVLVLYHVIKMEINLLALGKAQKWATKRDSQPTTRCSPILRPTTRNSMHCRLPTPETASTRYLGQSALWFTCYLCTGSTWRTIQCLLSLITIFAPFHMISNSNLHAYARS